MTHLNVAGAGNPHPWRHSLNFSQVAGDPWMTTGEILFLSLVVASMAVFALALGYVSSASSRHRKRTQDGD